MSVQTIGDGSISAVIPLLTEANITLAASAGLSQSDKLFQASAFAEVTAFASLEAPSATAAVFADIGAELLVTPPRLDIDVGIDLGLDAEIGTINGWLDIVAKINNILGAAGVKASLFRGTPTQWASEAPQTLPPSAGSSDTVVSIILSCNASVNPTTPTALGAVFGASI